MARVYVAGRVGKLAAYKKPPRRAEVRGTEGNLVYVRWLFGGDGAPVGFLADGDGLLDESKVPSLLIRQISERDAEVLAEHDAEVERAREAYAGICKERQNFMATAAKRGARVKVG